MAVLQRVEGDTIKGLFCLKDVFAVSPDAGIVLSYIPLIVISGQIGCSGVGIIAVT